MLLQEALALRVDRSVFSRSCVAALGVLVPSLSVKAPASADTALGATCMGFGCNPYIDPGFNGLEGAPAGSLAYPDFLQALKDKKVEGVVFMPPSGDVAFALIDGKSIRIGDGWPIEVSNSWSSPTWVVRILQNEGVPYQFAYDFEKRKTKKQYPPAFDKRLTDYVATPPPQYTPSNPRGMPTLPSALAPTAPPAPQMYEGAAAALERMQAGS